MSFLHLNYKSGIALVFKVILLKHAMSITFAGD